MSSSTSADGGSYISGTPVKSRPAAPSAGAPANEVASRFARRAPLAPPVKRDDGPASIACARPLAPPPAARAPPPERVAVPLGGGMPALRAGQGSSLRSAGSFSRLAEQRAAAIPLSSQPSALAVQLPHAAPVPALAGRVEITPPVEPRLNAHARAAAAQANTCIAEDAGSPDHPEPATSRKRPAATAVKPQAKRARAASLPAGGAPAKAPRAGASRDNFVKLQLGKAGRFKGAGGRKFTNGSSRPARRSRKPLKSSASLPDSTAEAMPLIDDDLCLPQPSRRLPSAAAAAAPAPRSTPAVRVVAELAADVVGLIAAAQEEPSAERLSGVLSAVFGFPSFRDGQLRVIQQTLEGRSCLAILPTGQGKSLCYQLAALLTPGVTLVISPLVALMDDQLAHLPPGLPGAVLHSGQTPEQAATVLDALRAGSLKVLFVAPERLLSRRFIELARALPARARFTVACVDECHCVSEWSHNFRPAYYHCGRVLRSELGIERVLALTATATRRTEAAVAAALCIPEEDIIRTACMRENLRLTVSRVGKRDEALLAMLRPGGRLEHAKSVIAYSSYKGESDRLAQFLYTNGIRALSYHAGKSPADRTKVQSMFHSNRVRVVVATVAFGMGLDKSDVHAVVNVGMPRSIEAYVQQVGRAGRDGSEAQCHTFIDDDEYLRLRSLTFSDGVDVPELLRLAEQIFPPGARVGTCSCVVVRSAELELGIRQEVLETVLSYLELGDGLPEEAPLVSALPEMRATIFLSFHKSDPEALAATSPLVEHVLKLGKARGGKHTVSVPQLATALGVSFAALQEQLQQLAATGEVSYTSSDDRALCMQIVRLPVDLRTLAAALAERLAAAEQCQVGKLDTIYTAVAAAAQRTEPAQQEAELRSHITAYFEAAGGSECLPPPPLVKQSSQHLLGDIRALLRQARDVLTSSRMVARVLHGLAGTHVSADAWRHNTAWNRHAAVDFNAVMRAAEAELTAGHTT